MMRPSPALFALIALCLAALACNLVPTAGGQPTSSAAITATPILPADSARPSVRVESPPEGAQVVARQQVLIKVLATDTLGVTRLEMREGGRVVAIQPSPDPVTTFEALLPYIPAAAGTVTLEVVAYRREVASLPVSLKLQVVGSAAELTNPGSLDPTTGAASGTAACTAQVNISNLNLREGPSTDFRVITKLKIGERLIVIGRKPDSSWLQVRREPSIQGWVSAQYVITSGECSRAPIVN